MTVSEIFAVAQLSCQGPVRWLEDLTERRPGVYVIALVDEPSQPLVARSVNVESLPVGEQLRWRENQSVIYIAVQRAPSGPASRSSIATSTERRPRIVAGKR